ncbi:MAG TPA: FAD-dependent oxidoreductase [Actinopolymorphaceae bacterium]|jgi:2-polyprenyl-6-methoxyphenol hydroxylase-like FAD-dependent oxidoreductase
MSDQVAHRTSVLVVGGSLTGLSSAVFLAWHGVPCVVVERHPDLLMHPRLRGIGPRTVEAYRQVGLEPAIKRASYAEEAVWSPIRANTLADDEYAAVDEPEVDDDDPVNASPVAFGAIDQDQLELILRSRALELGADLRFATEMLSFEQDDERVRAVVQDRKSGESYTIEADYMIAADGWASPIRNKLGIEVDGPGALFHTITAMVDADLNPATRGRRVSIAYLQQPQPFTVIMTHDNDGKRWLFGTGYSPEHESPADFTDERVADMVRAAAGLPDLEVRLRPQIPGTDIKILGFSIGGQLARRYRVGRIFLVGDAAHLVPPTGGLGGNAGVQDAQNLGWKLAAVLRGVAGPGLLDSYEEERRPVGQLTMEQALARFGDRMGPGAELTLLPYSAVSTGYRYRSSVLVGPDHDGKPLPAGELAGQVGTRAPHVEISQHDRESTIDLYGRNFVLLSGPADGAWVKAARAVADEFGVALDAYRLGVDLDAPDALARHALEPEGAILVRPDGVVAWRSDTGPAGSDPGARLADAFRTILSRA